MRWLITMISLFVSSELFACTICHSTRAEDLRRNIADTFFQSDVAFGALVPFALMSLIIWASNKVEVLDRLLSAPLVDDENECL